LETPKNFQNKFLFLQTNQKTGTVLKRRKEGRSWREEKGDGPGEKKKGTVLERRKEGRSWREKRWDGPGEKKKGTALEEIKI